MSAEIKEFPNKGPERITAREYELGEVIASQHARLMSVAITCEEAADALQEIATIQQQIALKLKGVAKKCREGYGQ